MKKLITILLILLGISYFSHAQTSIIGKAERLISKKDKEIKPHKQMKHFAKRPIDPKMRYNGTAIRRQKVASSKYKVDGNGKFYTNKKFENHSVNDNVRKVRNKATGTYVMKIR
jgi:hypothetical protein